jgi:glutamine amidotransferase-like uncharacterized protein
MNHPRRTKEESKKLTAAGWFPFPELNEEQNDIIFQARLKGFASCFPSYPTAQAQADSTYRAAQAFLKPWVKITETGFNHGGLFRCCVENFRNVMVELTPTVDEQNLTVSPDAIVTCPHCKEEIFLDSDLVWKWNRKS